MIEFLLAGTAFCISVVLLIGLIHLTIHYAREVRWIKPPARVICWPKDNNTPEPVVKDNRVLFPYHEDVLIAQASNEQGGFFRTINMNYWLQIPKGYTGIVSLIEGSFDEEGVFVRPQILSPGWQGDLIVNIGNRNSVEPAGCPAGQPFICLTLIGNPDRCIIDTEV